jgi:hypothetical protein
MSRSRLLVKAVVTPLNTGESQLHFIALEGVEDGLGDGWRLLGAKAVGSSRKSSTLSVVILDSCAFHH